MIKNLSIFFPLFNEEGNVETLVKKAVDVLEKLKLEYEIILVNDGSTDKTGEVVEKLVGENQRIKAINHPKNLGYGEALKSGFYNARYDTICYTDGDGQFDFSEIDKFLKEIEDHDLVIGYRIKRQDPFFRILFNKGWKLSLLAFFGLTLKDVDCGFKMIRKSVLEKIPHLESSRGAMINAELAIKAKKYGFKVTQTGVNHYPRLSGKPTGAGIKVIVKSFLDLLRLWWKLKDQKVLFIILVGILALAAFLRFYKIEEYMIFLGDQGRDAIIVKDMVDKWHFPLIGPPTSVGNIYLGPLYYYMMLPPMFLTGFNPVSAAAAVALIGVATVFLVYYLGKNWFGRGAGLLAAYLYAISPVTINYSRFSWNPNPLPFFALVAILGMVKLQKTNNFLWLLLTGIALGGALQMHYLALILVAVIVVLWFYQVLQKNSKKNFLKGTLLG
ncbi:MAG: glycosyltransferase, partial [Candidatus Daviesbacteria bacterium]|nr:glycosyltransferase [Candidatus Daviesbacteria bacterium]